MRHLLKDFRTKSEPTNYYVLIVCKVDIQQSKFTLKVDCPGAAVARQLRPGLTRGMVLAITDKNQASNTSTVGDQSLKFASFIHPDRFAPFLEATGHESTKAVNLYMWNIEVSSTFWGGFHMLEVSIRNAIHTKFVEHTMMEDWWEADVPIHDIDRDSITEAQKKVNELQDVPTPGHVIAELHFGFWVGLFANNYHSALWVNRLENAFPNYSGTRKDLHVDLERLRKLRNRIAHHEPIYRRDLRIDFRLICKVIRYIDNDISELVDSLSRVEEVIERKNHRIDGTIGLSF